MTYTVRHNAMASDGLAWMTRPYRLLRERMQRDGDTFEIDLGRHGVYLVHSRPDDVRAIFSADSSLMHAGKGNAVLKTFLGSGSLLLLDGAHHEQERRILQPTFHGRRLARHADVIAAACERRLARLRVGDVFRAQEFMQEVTLDVIVGIVFGDLPDPVRHALTSSLSTFLNDPKFNVAFLDQLDSDFEFSQSWCDFLTSLERVREILMGEIERRRWEFRTGDDVVTMLLEARYDDGMPMSDASVVDELLTMVVTGYETTATALSWSLYWTHRDARLCSELRDRCRGGEPAEAFRDEWMSALAKETLRLHPVIPIVARRTTRATRIGERDVPEGTTVAPCIYLVHHREDLYDAPDSFRPTRFLERTYASHEYLPFGGGPRRCLGMGLALMELSIVLATLVRRADLELVDVAAIAPQRRSVTVAPSRGTPMRVLALH